MVFQANPENNTVKRCQRTAGAVLTDDPHALLGNAKLTSDFLPSHIISLLQKGLLGRNSVRCYRIADTN
jgi:hypothetical protein